MNTTSQLQRQLIDALLSDIQKHFPEVSLIGIETSPEDSADVWVSVTAPDDEDRDLLLLDFVAKRSTEILIEHGHRIAVHALPQPQSQD
ncbi:MAG: hypothetical protein IAF08_00730 [Rhizobacter sp.]|nr:hypothetical protein [Chlorobiales bacterium]